MIHAARRGLLKTLPGSRSGQVATFMLLLIVVVLILALVTVNLGDLSMRATTVANAADASALYLGSQLASRAFQMWDSLKPPPGDGKGTTKKCKARGWLGLILAIVVAVVAIVVTWGAATGAVIPLLAWAGAHGMTVIAVGAAGGAAGGAMGGAIEGTGALQGAIQGAAIGAAIGGGLATLGAPSAASSAGQPAQLGQMAGSKGAVLQGMEGPVVLSPYEAVTPELVGLPLTPYPGMAMGSLITPHVAGAAIGGTLAIGSSVYNKYVADKALSDAFSAAARALNGLPDYQRIQQGIILDAMNRVVDDPNTVEDKDDLDADGDHHDQIPTFLVWWTNHINWLKAGLHLPDIPAKIQKFITAMTTFNSNAAKAFSADTAHGRPPGLLARQEVEGADGVVVQVARALRGINRPLSFWVPGPSQAQLKSWDELPCHETGTGCTPTELPVGFEKSFDEVDKTLEVLYDLAKPVDGTIDEILGDTTGTFRLNWSVWAPWFYDEDSDEDAYDALDRVVRGDHRSNPDPNPIVKGLNGWQEEIEAARSKLPECRLGHFYPSSFYEGSYQGHYRDWSTAPCYPDPQGQGVGGGRLDFDSCAVNPPCNVSNAIPTVPMESFRRPQQPGLVTTADADFFVPENSSQPSWKLEDEFVQAIDGLKALAAQIDAFRTAAITNLQSLPIDNLATAGWGGVNPVTYEWEDTAVSPGKRHSVTVLVGPFKLARVKKKSSFWKVCLELRNYKDGGGNAWVDIRRRDPPRELGLWRWNAGAETVHKRGRVDYSFDHVALSGTRH